MPRINVFVAADVFGYVSWNLNDTQIGQRLDRLAPCVDYISLMLYPSGFRFGIPGFRNPVEHPYEIVYRSLKKSRERTQIPSVRFRPWLQAFRDYAFDKRHFSGPEINEQIKAAEQFGSDGWMLWNPRNVYTADGLKRQPSLSWKWANSMATDKRIQYIAVIFCVIGIMVVLSMRANGQEPEGPAVFSRLRDIRRQVRHTGSQ